jgi:HK97 family phage prohead protease
MEERRISNKDAGIELRLSSEGPRIVGLAAVFYDGSKTTELAFPWGGRERIMPVAFDEALASNDDVLGLFDHDRSLLLGRRSAKTLALRKTPRGLQYEILLGETTVGRDVQEHVKRGDLNGSSFSFVALDEEWKKEDGEEVREVTRVKLLDVGPVSEPAYSATTVSARSDPAFVDARSSLEAFRSSRDEKRTAPKDARHRVQLVDADGELVRFRVHKLGTE